MFTGLIEELGEIRGIKDGPSFSLQIKATMTPSLDLGDSVATNGVCLTVANKKDDIFTTHVMPETLKKTNLRELKIGAKVNLERALTLQDPLGGHLLLGHVDTKVPIVAKKREGDFTVFTLPYEREHGPYLIPQGSVGVDGISLTIAKLTTGHFTISIIPHTLSQTILQFRGLGDVVNVEFDLLGKYVHRFMSLRGGGSLTQEYLKEQGFY